MIKQIKTILCLAVVAALVAPALATAQVYGHVALYNVKANGTGSFESVLIATGIEMETKPGFINDRVLRNIDQSQNLFASYAKFTNRADLEAAWADRVAVVMPYLERAPETHIVVLTDTFSDSGVTESPDGREFGTTQVGQIAHLGLFIPFNESRAEYDTVLKEIKQDTLDRQASGYIGEDLMVEADLPQDLSQQTPYTPQAFEAAKMSFNYGEYDTLEEAEDAYIRRGEDRPDDPQLVYWERVFYGALQVPTRFGIFQVIGNVSSSTSAIRLSQKKEDQVGQKG